MAKHTTIDIIVVTIPVVKSTKGIEFSTLIA